MRQPIRAYPKTFPSNTPNVSAKANVLMLFIPMEVVANRDFIMEKLVRMIRIAAAVSISQTVQVKEILRNFLRKYLNNVLQKQEL
jgi:hypothetical protein